MTPLSKMKLPTGLGAREIPGVDIEYAVVVVDDDHDDEDSVVSCRTVTKGGDSS